MINYIWFGMIALSVVCAAVNGRLSELSSAVMDGAGDAVDDVTGALSGVADTAVCALGWAF